MRYRIGTGVILGVFVFVSLFGLQVLMSHTTDHDGCPLMVAQTVMCENTLLEHVSMWQAMFVSILASLVLLCAAVIFFAIRADDLLLSHERLRIRVRSHVVFRPTLFQELYSRGILNCKEPYCF